MPDPGAYPSSSSAHLVGTSAAEQFVPDEHYDTPWEFKNRALAAVLGQQNLAVKLGASSNAAPAAENGVIKATQNGAVHQKDTNGQSVRKRLSLPQAMSKKLIGGNANGKVPSSERREPPPKAKLPPAAGTVSAHFQYIHQPTKVDSSFPVRASSSGTTHPPPPSLPFRQNKNGRSPGTDQASPNVSSVSSNEKSPPNQCQRQKPLRKAMPEPERKAQNGHAQEAGVVQLRNYPMVAMPTSPTAKEVIAFCQRRQCPALEELEHLVHEKLDRAQSEQLLRAMALGAHLLRRRPDRNLALSLRANEGVLHIKLEFRQGQWVLGDGPRFPTVHAMLRAYRRTELPVRGAEQIRLGICLRPADLPGGLLLL